MHKGGSTDKVGGIGKGGGRKVPIRSHGKEMGLEEGNRHGKGVEVREGVRGRGGGEGG